MLQAGTVVAGRYKLMAPIGEGAMAAVWRAEDVTLKRQVAVKLLHVQGASDPQAMVDQFLREARIAASIQHRNVIQTVDFGTVETQPFMVMELLDGESMQDRIEREPPLSPEQVIHLASLTLRGLSAVHDAGIVHRDLKPANIFLQRDAETVYPKILDFGISRSVTHGEERPSAIATQMGLIIGTPDYMSPEQARGDADIDRRADIYSMGVILYQGLSGRLPFNCKSIGELIVAILTQDPPELLQIRPDVHPALSKMVAQAMRKDRESRFGDASAMRHALMGASEQAFKRARTLMTSDAPLSMPSSTPPPPMPSPGSKPRAGGGGGGSGWGDFAELATGPKGPSLELAASVPPRGHAPPPPPPPSVSAAPGARRKESSQAAKPRGPRAPARPGTLGPAPPAGVSAYAANAFDGLDGGPSLGGSPSLDLDAGAVRALDRAKPQRGPRSSAAVAERRKVVAKAESARSTRNLAIGAAVVLLAFLLPALWYLRPSPLPAPSGAAGPGAAFFTRPPASSRRPDAAKLPVHLRDVSFESVALPVAAPAE